MVRPSRSVLVVIVPAGSVTLVINGFVVDPETSP
jgi:hypothetical protein